MTSWSALTWQALLGEQPTVTRTCAPEFSRGGRIVFAPACSVGADQFPTTLVVRATCRVTGRPGAGDGAAGRGAADDRGLEVARGVELGVAGVCARGVGLDECVEAVGVGIGASTAGDEETVARGVGGGTGVDDAGNGGTGIGDVDGNVIASSPTSVGTFTSSVVLGVAAVAGATVSDGARDVTMPNTAPPAIRAALAMARCRGVSCMTVPRLQCCSATAARCSVASG